MAATSTQRSHQPAAGLRRDGEAVEIANEEIVPGDVLLLAPGHRVAADADLLVASDLRADESMLTGEAARVAPEDNDDHGRHRHWLFLLAWPPLVLGADEARKARTRRKRSAADAQGVMGADGGAWPHAG